MVGQCVRTPAELGCHICWVQNQKAAGGDKLPLIRGSSSLTEGYSGTVIAEVAMGAASPTL